jgi:hypothetical protein
MTTLSKITIDDATYEVIEVDGALYLHQTDTEARFPGSCILIEPGAVESIIAGLGIWLANHDAREQRIREMAGRVGL